MLGTLLLAGLVGTGLYLGARDKRDQNNSFEKNSTKNYSKFCTMTYFIEPNKITRFYVDGYFLASRVGRSTISVTEIYNVPIGSELSMRIASKLDPGEGELMFTQTVTENSAKSIYTTKLPVNEYGELMEDY